MSVSKLDDQDAWRSSELVVVSESVDWRTVGSENGVRISSLWLHGGCCHGACQTEPMEGVGNLKPA